MVVSPLVGSTPAFEIHEFGRVLVHEKVNEFKRKQTQFVRANSTGLGTGT